MKKKWLRLSFLAAGCSALALLAFSCANNASSNTTYRTVRFDSNGGSEVAPQTMPDGALAIPPDMPEKNGCDFSGWYREAELAGEYDFNSPVKSDLILYAKWEQAEFSVLFNANGGKWLDNTSTKQIAQPGSKFVLPAEPPKKPDTAFIGWYHQQQTDIPEETPIPATPPSVTIDTDFDHTVTTLYALYQTISPHKVAVYFKLFDGGDLINNTAVSVDKETVISPSAIPTGLTRTHYQRNGTGWWYDNAHEFDMSQALTESVVSAANTGGETNQLTLFAKWTGNTYTLTFHANGGYFGEGTEVPLNTTETYSLTYPAEFTAPANPAHQAFIFDGWNTQMDGKGTALGAGQTQVSGDAGYYAMWKVPEGGLDYPPESSEEPWLGGSTMMTIPTEGWYKIELWGAQGGPAGTGNSANYTYNETVTGAPGTITSGVTDYQYMLQGVPYSVKGEPLETPAGIMSGGRGAYTAGYIYLNTGDILHINIGGARVDHDENSAGGGFNGGGTGGVDGDGAGGGATDVRFGGNELRHRIMVAGGGGGSADGRLGGYQGGGEGAGDKQILWKGGYAGTIGVAYTNLNAGAEHGCGDDKGFGGGWAQGGRTPASGGQRGVWGYGGNAAEPGLIVSTESFGAGGGGWFGGSSGGRRNSNGSGGGGSSYISGAPGFIACAETSTDVQPSGSGGDGIGGFVPRYAEAAEVTPEEMAASWTGKVFVHPVARSGKQPMPNPGESGGMENGHAGPGAAKIQFMADAGANPAVPPADDTPFTITD